jgi:WD40 repeat protein
VIGGWHSQIHVWHLKPREIAAHEKEVWSLAFSPDGSSLASGADDHAIKLWDMSSDRERTTLKGHESLVTAVAYSPDGKRIASASFDSTIRLWDVTSEDPPATLRGHDGRVRALTFSPDGATLATAGDDLGIRLWDVNAKRELSPPLAGHTSSVFALAFAPDCKTLFSGSMDKTIRLWDRGTTEAREVWNADEQVYSLAVRRTVNRSPQRTEAERCRSGMSAERKSARAGARAPATFYASRSARTDWRWLRPGTTRWFGSEIREQSYRS